MEDIREIKILIKIIGWAGTILIITAYALNSFGYISSQNIIYPFLNLFGAVLIGIRVLLSKNWSNLFLQFFWALIAVVSIIFLFT